MARIRVGTPVVGMGPGAGVHQQRRARECTSYAATVLELGKRRQCATKRPHKCSYVLVAHCLYSTHKWSSVIRSFFANYAYPKRTIVFGL